MWSSNFASARRLVVAECPILRRNSLSSKIDQYRSMQCNWFVFSREEVKPRDLFLSTGSSRLQHNTISSVDTMTEEGLLALGVFEPIRI